MSLLAEDVLKEKDRTDDIEANAIIETRTIAVIDTGRSDSDRRLGRTNVKVVDDRMLTLLSQSELLL